MARPYRYIGPYALIMMLAYLLGAFASLLVFSFGWPVITACLGWSPLVIFLSALGVAKLRWHLRAPDVVIEVAPKAVPLAARFLEQDRRLERRERLKAELDRVNVEIETFNATMDADTRKAWFSRPGPYGK